MRKFIAILCIGLSVLSFKSDEQVNWLTFGELEMAFTAEPKKVIINFYADWCVYCKKMEKAVYTKPEILRALNESYYAVRFNVESTDTIHFGGKEFVNLNTGKKRTAFHQIPELIAGRENQELELPATVVFDEQFNIIKRYYRYLSPKEMAALLK